MYGWMTKGLLAGVLGAAVLSACDSGHTAGQTPASRAAAGGGVRPDCAAVLQAKPTDPARNLVLLLDRTASRPAGTAATDVEANPALADTITSYSRAGGSITIISVNGHGAGAKPRFPLYRAALSDAGPRDAPSVERIAKNMPGCIQHVLAQVGPPTAPGTDFYPAADEAAKVANNNRSTVVWLTDVAFNAGQIDLSRPGVLDLEAPAAAKLIAGRAPLDFHGATLLVAGAGDLVQDITPQGQRWLAAFAAGLCAAWHAVRCGDIVPAAGAGGSAMPGLPADPKLPFPAVTPVSLPAGCEFTVPGALGFGGDSTALRPGFSKFLGPVIAIMADHPKSTAVVTGHAASTSLDPGPQNVGWSKGRADSVVGALVQSGIASSRLTARGVGNLPRIKDMDPATGQQIPDIAATERWVKITVAGVPCPR